MNTTYDSLTT